MSSSARFFDWEFKIFIVRVILIYDIVILLVIRTVQ